MYVAEIKSEILSRKKKVKSSSRSYIFEREDFLWRSLSLSKFDATLDWYAQSLFIRSMRRA